MCGYQGGCLEAGQKPCLALVAEAHVLRLSPLCSSCIHCPEHVALMYLPGTKVFVMPNGMLKSNQQLVDIIEKVKPEIRLLIEKCNTVRRGS